MSTFRFQQFSVRQEKSAMKVCTDATLFGAMAPVKGGEQVLDIGTGTGLLALMAAQLGASHITGVELTEAAFDEAQFNFCNSPWNGRMEAVHCSIQHFSVNTPDRYDLIISNPPFFHNHSKTSDQLKRQARHTDLLPFPDLLASVDRLLADSGHFYLLLPSHAATGFAGMALEHGLHLIEQTDFRGHCHNQAKVSALTFCHQQQPCRSGLLTLYQSDRIYSQESTHYLSPFLLRFSQQN
ncbi:MAG: methyltransferase [Gammaproteobacteria bacterium]|nr:methyltransferase [Gammaproteobacteria bacterium]